MGKGAATGPYHRSQLPLLVSLLRCASTTTRTPLHHVRHLSSGPASSAPSFEVLGVKPHLAARLREFGITTPTETQILALPSLIQERSDAVLRAETGSGKTLCYLLPILQLVEHRFQHQLKALADGAAPKELWELWSRGEFPDPPELPPRGAELKRRAAGKGQETDLQAFFRNAQAMLGEEQAAENAAAAASGDEEEEMEARLPAAPRIRPMGATGLILVPTQELARQVTAVIGDLAPQVAPLVRMAYADKGVSRRDMCAIVVATPAALAENVNSSQLDNLGMLVLDEADMLLSAGSYQEMTQGFALLKMHKQRSPELRPQTLFCAATVPSRGKRSVAAFLDQYYPESEGVLRLSTAGAHRHVTGLVRNTFIQLDAGLPLTLEEKEAQQKMASRVQAHAEDVKARLAQEKAEREQLERELKEEEAALADAAANGKGQKKGKGKAKKAKKADQEPAAAAAAAPAVDLTLPAVAEQAGDEELGGGEEGGEDRLASFMAARSDEDRASQVLADREQYWKRVDSLRKHALLEALLLPLKAEAASVAGATSGITASAAATASAEDALAAEEDAAPSAGGGGKASRKRKGSSSLLFSTAEALKGGSASFSKKMGRAIAEGLKPSIAGSATGETTLAASGTSSGASQETDFASEASAEGSKILPLRLYENTGLRSRLEARELLDPATQSSCVLPQTLVFFNSADKVDAARRFLNSALPIKDVNWAIMSRHEQQKGQGQPKLLRVGALHNRLSDDERAALVRDFHSGAVTVLLCTDVASRGLDTRNVGHVIQADFAQDAVSYLHRVGRTARAGTRGSVTNLVTRANLDLAQALLACAAEWRSIDDAFSRNRSFRSRVRKAALTAAEEKVIMEALEAEASSLQGTITAGNEAAAAKVELK